LTLENLIQDLSDRLEIDFPAAGEDGNLSITFDDDLTVSFVPSGRRAAFLCGTVGTTPQGEQAADDWYRDLLKRNLAVMKTQVEVLCLAADAGEVLLHRQIDLQAMDPDRFEETVEGFVDTLEYWRGVSGPVENTMASPFSVMFP
jgi:hypothetical protein